MTTRLLQSIGFPTGWVTRTETGYLFTTDLDEARAGTGQPLSREDGERYLAEANRLAGIRAEQEAILGHDDSGNAYYRPEAVEAAKGKLGGVWLDNCRLSDHIPLEGLAPKEDD